MGEPSRKYRFGAIVWALIFGVSAIMLAGSILLPSTKRAHFDFSRQSAQESPASATTELATAPAP